MQDLSLLTWKEIKEIDKEKSIVFSVMAPIEEHGWHLPLATDLIEGEYWSKGAMKIAEDRSDATCFYLPSFPIASASVNEFYGSIHLTMKTCLPVADRVGDAVVEVSEDRCMHLNFKGGFSEIAEAHKVIHKYAGEHNIGLSDRAYEVYNKDMSVDVYYCLA